MLYFDTKYLLLLKLQHKKFIRVKVELIPDKVTPRARQLPVRPVLAHQTPLAHCDC